jgi:hypothetical protein
MIGPKRVLAALRDIFHLISTPSFLQESFSVQSVLHEVKFISKDTGENPAVFFLSYIKGFHPWLRVNLNLRF